MAPSEEFIKEVEKLNALQMARLNKVIQKYWARGEITDRDATLTMMGYIHDFIAIQWKGADVIDVLKNILEIEYRNRRKENDCP